jgi:hypothetical protein
LRSGHPKHAGYVKMGKCESEFIVS